MFQAPDPADNSRELQRITQISRNSPTDAMNYVKFTPIINPFILCFTGLPRQRMLRNSSKSYRFRSIRPQTPRITGNSHQLLTHLYYVSEACPGRELPKIPANQAKFAQFTHRSHELCKFHAFHTKLHPYLVH